MVRHTTSAGASIRTSRSIVRPGICISSHSALATHSVSATDSSASEANAQPLVAYIPRTRYRRLHIEKEGTMKNALRTEGADAPLASTRAAGLPPRLATSRPSQTLGTSRPPRKLAASRPSQMTSQRRKAFALLVVAYFITIVDFTIVNVALPTIGRELRFPESDLQWLVTAYGLTFAGFLLLGGRAADLLGQRRVLMAGLIVFTAASLGGGLAASDTVLIVMRGIQGLGAALVLPAALSTVTSMFPEGAERNKALGIWGGAGALGGTVGLLAGGILTTYAGWQYIFFFNVPIGAPALALAPKVLPESRARSGPRRYDVFGAVSVTAAMLLLVYAVAQAPQAGWAAAQTVAMLAGGVALLGLFLVVEARVPAPLLPLPLLRVSGVAGANAVGFLLGASWTTFVFLGTLYMQQVLGYSAFTAGAAWTMASVISFALAGAG